MALKSRYEMNRFWKALGRHLVLWVSLLCVSSASLAEDWSDLLELSGHHTQTDRQSQKETQTSQSTRFRPSNQSQRQQVAKRLDQEILVLRAEKAKEHGDVRRVHQYLQELNAQRIAPIYLGRVSMLERFVDYHSDVYQSPAQAVHVQQLDVPVLDRDLVIAIVLPASGDYGVAGSAIQQAIQEGLDDVGFKGQLLAIDSAQFLTADEIWQTLRPYHPNLIFGPLQKDLVEQWKALGVGVKTVFFNNSNHLGVGQFSLSPNRISGLEQVFQLLQQAEYHNVLVLRDGSFAARELEESFYQAWSTLYDSDGYHLQVIEGNVGKSIDDSFDISGSKSRKRGIQRIVASALQFSPRRRQDFDAVISFVPQKLAIQVVPYLNFLTAHNELTHIWYPSKTPSSRYLQFNKDAWQQTYVILPQSIEIDPNSNRIQIKSSDGQGLFYALGRVAVELIAKPNLASKIDTLEETGYGSVVRDASGQFHLLPDIYWADKGRFGRLSYYE